MIGASARYSRLHIPVETGTGPSEEQSLLCSISPAGKTARRSPAAPLPDETALPGFAGRKTGGARGTGERDDG